MKKIISSAIAVLMMATFSATSFASMVSVSTPVVGPASTTAVADIVLDVENVSALGMIQLNFLLPDGVTLSAVDHSEFDALCEKATNDNSLEIGQILIYDDDQYSDVTALDDVTITCTFTIPAADKGTSLVIPFDTDNTMVISGDGEQIEGVLPTGVIVAAGTTETKNTYEEGCGTYVQGFLVDCAVTNGNDDTAVKSATFKIDNGSAVADAKVSLPTAVKNGTIRLAVNVEEVPETTTLALDSVVLSAN